MMFFNINDTQKVVQVDNIIPFSTMDLKRSKAISGRRNVITYIVVLHKLFFVEIRPIKYSKWCVICATVSKLICITDTD